MKKSIILILMGFIIAFVYFSFQTVSVTPEETTMHYKEKWGIEMPVPDAIIDVWSTKFPARGDGEWVTEFNYDRHLSPEQLNDFTKVTEENLSQANGYVYFFMNRVKSMYAIQRDDAFKKAIEPYAVNLKLGEYYIHQSKNGDYDTFTAIYQQQENRILIFEWHQ